MRSAALVLACLPAAAFADCAAETLVSCDVGWNRRLEVCITPGDANGNGSFSYSFGPPGAPELQLSVPMSALTVRPWSGVGRSIWASVGFPNAGYVYEVWHSYDRLAENPVMEAGVNVVQGDATLAAFTCQPGGTIAPAFALEDAMAAAGYCWNTDSFAWQRGGCG
jgi:hypothetical protein